MISGVVTLSIVFLVAGLATNFTMDVDEDEVRAYVGSIPTPYLLNACFIARTTDLDTKG